MVGQHEILHRAQITDMKLQNSLGCRSSSSSPSLSEIPDERRVSAWTPARNAECLRLAGGEVTDAIAAVIVGNLFFEIRLSKLDFWIIREKST